MVYGRPPPLLVSCEKGVSRNHAVEQELLDRDEVIAKVNRQLKKVQKRMKKYHDQGRRVMTFQVGYYVYLKLQLAKQKSMCQNPSAKLYQKYYGPYRIVEKFGNVAYKLQLPPTLLLYSVSCVFTQKESG